MRHLAAYRGTRRNGHGTGTLRDEGQLPWLLSSQLDPSAELYWIKPIYRIGKHYSTNIEGTLRHLGYSIQIKIRTHL